MSRLSLLLAAALLVGCGSDEDDNGDRTEAPPPAAGLVRFESERIGFTFDYPESFVAQKRPREGVLARVGVERGSRLNAIKVRRTARRELDPDRYLAEFQRDFERSVGTVDRREERIGDLEAGVLEFDDTLKRGAREVRFTSASYFFSGGGQTWQLECISDEAHREEIERACKVALGSVAFRG